jgi:hypothetical protein
MIEPDNFESEFPHYSSIVNLSIKMKINGQLVAMVNVIHLPNLVEKSSKLRCEVGHMEFIEINIIMQSRASRA